MNAPWRIEMLGGLRVFHAGSQNTPITRFSTVKTASLLTYLACFPRRVHPREELIDRFWPTSEIEAGRSSLRAALSSLRRQLEPPGTPAGAVLDTDRHNVRLNPSAFTTDVAEFEALLRKGDISAALRVYAGEFLPGFYDDWSIEERERLAALHEKATAGSGSSVSLRREEKSLDAEGVIAMPGDEILLPPYRLPLTLTRFVGRESEVAALADLLSPGDSSQQQRRRLVTVTGAGGTGKTRLAIETARYLAADFDGAVFFVPLADLSDAGLIASQVARTVDTSVPGSDPLQDLTRALSVYPAALVILDNMEQFAEAGAFAVQTLLSRLPNLAILVTSRRRLGIAGEREIPLAPLPAPEESEQEDAARVVSYASVRLFVELAQAVRPDFQVTSRNAATIGALCRALDGLPLALELAAARFHSLTPAQMLDGLQNSARWDLLASRKRDKTERHRSLHAAIEWSLHLLPPALADFWSRLSVFRGGCDAAAAAAITGDNSALERLSGLRDRSLIVTEVIEASETGMRFRLLEALREFAASRLEGDEQALLAAGHARFYTERAEAALPHLQGPEAASYLAALDTDRDNLRAALTYCCQHDTLLGLRIGGALWRFWEMRGYLSEGRTWLQTLLESGAGDGTPERAKAVNGAGMLAARQGDYTAARTYHEQSLALNRVLEQPQGVAAALGNLGLIAAEQGRYHEAQKLYEESLALRRRIGDEYGIGLMLNNLGTLTCEQGDYAASRIFLEEAVTLRQKQGDTGGVAATLGNLGNTVFLSGDYEEARRLHEQGLAVLRELGDKRGIAYALLNLGEMAATKNDPAYACRCHSECLPLLYEMGDRWALAYALDSVAGIALPEEAARLRGAASVLREDTGAGIPPNHQEGHDRAAADLRALLGEAAFTRSTNAGRKFSLKDAVALAREQVA